MSQSLGSTSAAFSSESTYARCLDVIAFLNSFTVEPWLSLLPTTAFKTGCNISCVPTLIAPTSIALCLSMNILPSPKNTPSDLLDISLASLSVTPSSLDKATLYSMVVLYTLGPFLKPKSLANIVAAPTFLLKAFSSLLVLALATASCLCFIVTSSLEFLYFSSIATIFSLIADLRI